jgi:uncharacterized SAM-binding protein YcdF (DUF218 family)
MAQIVAGVAVWRVVRTVLKILLVVAAALVAYLAVTAVQVWLTSRHRDAHAAQAIVVMGAAQYDGVPSPDLRARLATADDLWARHLAPVLVVTGYKETGDVYTEAEASAEWLENERGRDLATSGGVPAAPVPASDVIEVDGRDSWGNLADAAAALHARGLDNVLIVTDGFHEDRSLAIAHAVGLTASGVPAVDSPISGWSAVPYFAKETVGVALGRIIGYNHLGVLHDALR